MIGLMAPSRDHLMAPPQDRRKEPLSETKGFGLSINLVYPPGKNRARRDTHEQQGVRDASVPTDHSPYAFGRNRPFHSPSRAYVVKWDVASELA